MILIRKQSTDDVYTISICDAIGYDSHSSDSHSCDLNSNYVENHIFWNYCFWKISSEKNKNANLKCCENNLLKNTIITKYICTCCTLKQKDTAIFICESFMMKINKKCH